MEFEIAEEYLPALSPKVRYVILMGGRSAGRSHFASQVVTASLKVLKYFRCALMRFVAGDIRSSIFQEVLDRIEEKGAENIFDINESGLKISYGNNFAKGIGFRKSSSEQKAKMKSLAGFNCAILEEADEIAEEDFMQFDDSLRKAGIQITIYLLLNAPAKGHWIIKRWFKLVEPDEPEAVALGFMKPVLRDEHKQDTVYIHTCFENNLENISQSTIDNFNKYRTTKPDHYWNMIRGYVSQGARGRIFNWETCTLQEYLDLPYEETFGLDFGFTNDPTALVGIKKHNEKVWCRLLVYQKGLLNAHIAQKFKDYGIDENCIIYADSAEPKSIKELQTYGFNVIKADKGQDSVVTGISLMLTKEIVYS